MATADDRRRARDDDGPSVGTGEVLGISRVTPGPTGELRPPREKRDREDTDEDRVTGVEDPVDLGARDVTKSSHGQTGPATGGHGSTPQRSGATGTDIGD